MMTRHIGIYSGAFDPVHPGHIAFAAAALRDCRLDEVVFLPEQSPRGKQHATSIDGRQAALDAALADLPGLRAARLVSHRFTVAETLPELRRLFEATELTFLMGSDVARGLAAWPGIALLLREVSLAIGLRSGDNAADMTAILEALVEHLGIQIKRTFISTAFADVTSSQIRLARKGVTEA